MNVDWNIVAASVSAVGAIAAAWAAFASRSTAEKTLQLQNRLYVYESLKACAERANEYAKGKRGADWSTNDAANITRNLGLAMGVINQTSKLEAIEVMQLKKYFMNLLCIELFEEVHDGDAPDAVYKNEEPTRISNDILIQWGEAVTFFDIWDYAVATDQDLAD